MSYLTKEQYESRRENAAERSIENEVVAVENGMTTEQAELISRLCYERHRLHTNMDHIVKCDDMKLKDSIVKLNAAIADSGLPYIESIPNSIDSYIDIDDIDLLYAIGDAPESFTDEWQEWYDSNYDRIYNELEKLNQSIEEYLAKIDSMYGTSFCPTGALRIF